ncbi:MAG: calcium-binding protein [Pirellulaceae bacterium]
MGNDRLLGDSGQDEIHGGEGIDIIQAGIGNDTVYGDEGDDSIYLGEGDDYAEAGDGNDFLIGDAGNDDVYLGAGDDYALGGDGDDYIRGEAGEDIIFGGNDNDRLVGGDAYDRLYGQNGRDGLIGGPGFGDLLVGGANDDRFLSFDNDIIQDMQFADARLRFRNKTSAWTTGEMEVLDVGFAKMHFLVRNTRLLKDSLSDDPIIVEKVATLPFANESENKIRSYFRQEWDAINEQWITVEAFERTFQFAEWFEGDATANQLRERRVYHEISHNWNSQEEIAANVPSAQYLWNEFKLKSRWTDENPNDPVRYHVSYDNQWFYIIITDFARDFAKTNPYEDWATIWEVAFDDTLQSQRRDQLEKISVVDRLISAINGFSA